MVKHKWVLQIFSLIVLLGQNVYANSPSFPIKNESSFYLFAKDAGPGCPTRIAPGQEGISHEYWCGFIACATDQYDQTKGCLEKNSDETGLTEGGYATWFSISFSNGICTVPETNVYECQWKNNQLTFDYRKLTQKFSAGAKMGQNVELSQPQHYNKGPQYRGVNISGLEYDGTFLDALYQHPDKPDIRYFIEKGMNTVRLPIRWEFLVSTSPHNLIESTNPTSLNINSMYLEAVYDTLEKYLASGVAVVLDLHNYMRFCNTGASRGQANEPTDPIKNQCTVMNADQLTYIWGIIARKFATLANTYPNLLIFEVMNEPYSFVDADGKRVSEQIIKTQDLFNAEVQAVKEIRKFAKNNYVMLSGNYWDPLHGWVFESPFLDDLPNGSIFTAKNLQAAGIDIARIILDMHQYFDSNYSGTHQQCIKFQSYQHFKTALKLEDEQGKDIFGQWIKDNNMKIFLGEFGASTDNECREDLNYMLRYVEEHAYDTNRPTEGGFIGWTAWRANRHGGGQGFAPFNFLQNEDYTVYGANGDQSSSLPGTGIQKGQGNGLMQPHAIFSFLNYLVS